MKKLYVIMSMFVLVAMVLSACVTAAPTPTAVPPTAVPPTKPPATAAPTVAPTIAATAAPTAVPLGKVLKIGMLATKSGAVAYYGVAQERGFMIGLEYASGGKKDAAGNFIIANRPVQVIVKDDEGNADKAVALARELVEKEGVELLQGPTLSGPATSLTNLAKEYKMVMMVDPAAAASITGASFNPYVFRTSRTSYDDTLVIAKYLVDNVGKNFASLAVDTAFGKSGAAALKFAVEKYGGKLAADIYVPADAKDFTPYLQKALDSKAENLFLTWAGTGYVTLFQQITDLGVAKKMKVATGLSVYHYMMPKNPVNDFLVKRYFELYKEPPDLFSPGGMASAIAFAAALEKTKGDATGDTMIKALEGLKFDGPKGTYFIRPEDHVALQPMYIVKLTNLDPHKQADGRVLYDWFEKVYESKYDELGIPCTLAGEYASRCGNLPKP